MSTEKLERVVQIPAEVLWLDAAGVGRMLGYEARVVRRPGFPRPAKISSREKDWRWSARETLAWRAARLERLAKRCKERARRTRRRKWRNASSEYNIWKKIHYRCNNPKAHNFKWYGGRGIVVSARWADFHLFLADMGPRPSPAHSIDRIDNYRGYEPGNCRWATQAEQNANRRCPRCDGKAVA